MKPMLKAPGSKRLKLKESELLSIVAFKINLRSYNLAADPPHAPELMLPRIFACVRRYQTLCATKVKQC
jgi:hypothetical protein